MANGTRGTAARVRDSSVTAAGLCAREGFGVTAKLAQPCANSASTSSTALVDNVDGIDKLAPRERGTRLQGCDRLEPRDESSVFLY